MEFVILVILGLVFLLGAPLGCVAFFKTNAQARKLDEMSGELFKLRNLVAKLERGEGLPSPTSEESPAQNIAAERTADPVVQEDVSEAEDEPIVEDSDIEEVAAAAMTAADEIEPVSATTSERAENTIGGKLSVWIGGITMALGSIFLVRYALSLIHI